jgi:Cd2+/Zn2+-exporting ATPase
LNNLIELNISGMDCADCAKTLESGVGQINGVESCRVVFMTGKMHIEGAPDMTAVKSRVEQLGYGIREEALGDEPSIHAEVSGVTGFLRYMLQKRESTITLISAAILGLTFALALLDAPELAIRALQLLIIAAVGLPIMKSGVQQFIFSRKVTINLLMSIAVIGALAINEWHEAATVIVLFAIAETLEGYSADRARGALASLLQLAPQRASVIRPCMDCAEHLGKDGYEGGPCPWCEAHEQQVPVAEVAVGETLMVKPGERIPLDGRVIEGASAVDQAPITGESIPVHKSFGDDVFAGSVNGHAVLTIEVTQQAENSTLNRIIRLVEAAQAQKAPSERFVDRFAAWYTPAVVILAGLVVVIPTMIFGATFDTWLYRGLALLVVACPCALVISTPVTVVSAMVRAAHEGILIKGGTYLEALGKIRVFAFDKTGTLTRGEPQVIQIKSVDCDGDDLCADCDHMLTVASALERQSEHPLGQAIVREAVKRGLSERHLLTQSVMALAGQGIRGQVEDQPVTVGSHSLFDAAYPHADGICSDVDQQERHGQTVMMVAESDRVLGFISVADTLREGIYSILQSLPAHKVMLTGDNQSVAQAIAQQAGIDSVRANLLPDDKASAIQQLVAEHGAVAMVGDGVNDAPALAAATVGIAMGGAGTAQAMETADVVLMQDDLSKLPTAVNISRRAGRVIRQNIGISLLIKAVFVALTLLGLTTLWLAVFADMGMSLLVTFNGMRLLRGGHYHHLHEGQNPHSL